jgi:acetyl esterase/lipase
LIPSLTLVRLVCASILFGFGLLTIIKVPVGFLWMPAVGALEWGHLMGVAAVLLAVPGWGEPKSTASFALATTAALLLFSPLVRAFSAANVVETQVHRILGEIHAREAPHALARPAPFVPTQLLSIGVGKAKVERHLVREIDGVRLDLDFYGAKPGAHRPVIIAIHGGSWSGGDLTQLPDINHYFARRGYGVAAISYRLAPAHVFPAQLEDVRAAISWVKENAQTLGIDPKRIVLLGRSAGGHLALTASYTASDPDIRGVVAYYAPNDLNWSWANPSNPWVLDSPKTLSGFLGGTPETAAEAFNNASPLDFVTPKSSPTLLVHGGRDELVFAEQSERLATRLEAKQVLNIFVRLPWATHGCEANLAGPCGQISTWAIERFIAHVTADTETPPL